MHSEIPRLTRAQRSQCLSNQREFIAGIIEELGPNLEVEYTFDGPKIALEDRAGDLLNTRKILLKSAYRINGDLQAFGVFFNNGRLEWEQISITYN
jgi:hypothetical protein